MTLKPLEEDFRRLGLSDKQICESMASMGGSKQEADSMDEGEEEDFEDVYLSDLVDEEDGEGDDEGLDEMTKVRTKKSTSAEKRAARQAYKANRSKIARQMKKKRKTSAWKRHQAKLAKAPKGGRRTRRYVDDIEDVGEGSPSIHEALLGELNVLAESIDREPVSRFNEYAEAFNHIADLGEMTAMQVMDEDEDAARELLSLSLNAEDVLKQMENMDGALTAEEDEILEATLADALEDVGQLFENHGLLDEEDEDEDEEEYDEEEDVDEDDEELDEDVLDSDNPFLAAAASLREARGKMKRGRAEAPAKRKLLNPKSTKAVKGRSAWGKIHGKGASRKQLMMRKDVKSVEGLLGYLRKVKAGKVAPGQPLRMTKKGGNVRNLPKGARAAMAAAGK